MLLYVTRPYSWTYRSTICQSSKGRRIRTVSPAMRMFLILMGNYRSVLLSNLTDVFPYVGAHWQTYGCVTAAYHFTNSFYIHKGCPCSFASLNTNT